MSLKKRILTGLSSGVFGTATTLIIQLVGIPILLTYWGKELYGEWLVLFTLPSYIAMSDIGLGTVACTEINVLISQNKTLQARNIFNSTFNFIIQLGLIPLIILSLLSFWPTLRSILNIEKMSEWQFTFSFLILCAYSFLAILITLPQGLYRSIGLFGRGQYVATSFRILEFVFFLVAVLLKLNIIGVAFSYFISRILYAAFVINDLRNKTDVVDFSLHKYNISSIKSLIKPSVSMMSVYLGQSFLSQGIIIIISITLGAASVAIFSITRTLCNMAKQPLMIISLTFWGEFTTAYARKDKFLVSKLFNIANRSTILLSFIAVIFLYFFGEWILIVWTQGKIQIEKPFYTIFLISIITNILWYTRWNFLLSVNKHTQAVYFYLASTILIVGLMWILAPFYGLVAVAVTLIFMDLIMIPVVYKLTNRIFYAI